MSRRIDRKVVHERLSSLVWKCLDNDLNKTAHFYAERLFAFDGSNHEARHLLATATLRLNQPHSALHLVTRPRDDQCAGCYEIAAKCSTALGRHSKARSLLEYSIVLSTTSPISTSIIISIISFRVAHPPLPPHPFSKPPTIHRTTHNSRRVHSSRRSFSSLPLGYPRCQGLPHLRGHRKLYTSSSTRTPPVGSMDRPLCPRCVYITAFNIYLIFDLCATIYRRKG